MRRLVFVVGLLWGCGEGAEPRAVATAAIDHADALDASVSELRTVWVDGSEGVVFEPHECDPSVCWRVTDQDLALFEQDYRAFLAGPGYEDLETHAHRYLRQYTGAVDHGHRRLFVRMFCEQPASFGRSHIAGCWRAPCYFTVLHDTDTREVRLLSSVMPISPSRIEPERWGRSEER